MTYCVVMGAQLAAREGAGVEEVRCGVRQAQGRESGLHSRVSGESL